MSRRYSALFGAIRRYSALFGAIWRYLAPDHLLLVLKGFLAKIYVQPSPITASREAEAECCGGARVVARLVVRDPQCTREVGIEFVVVADTAGPGNPAYLVPLAYRGAPLPDAPDEALVGICEHGVLGTRWVYDGVQDPVVRAQLTALLRGGAVAQHQNESDTPEPTVTLHGTGSVAETDVHVVRVLRAAQAEDGAPTHLVAGWTRPDGTSARGVFARTGQGTAPARSE